MKLLARFSAWVEIYSIDEAFLGVSGTLDELQALGEQIKAEVFRLTGLPVCVGIAKTTGTAEYSLVAYWTRSIRVPSWNMNVVFRTRRHSPSVTGRERFTGHRSKSRSLNLLIRQFVTTPGCKPESTSLCDYLISQTIS